jgi:glycosyltransferase involved in cell wall biosynthesis
LVFMNKPETMQTNMNIKGVLMLVNHFRPLPVGGAERQAERLAEYMSQKNLWVGVITRKVGVLPKVEKRSGFNIYRVWQFGSGKFKSGIFTVGAFFGVLRLRKYFDILHAHMEFSSAVAATIAGKLIGKPVIVKFSSSGYASEVKQSYRTWLGRLRLGILRRWANAYIALTSEMEEELLAEGFSRSKVIRMNNGINANDFSPTADKESAKAFFNLSKMTVIIFIGRLVPVKALPVLLTAFERVLKVDPSLHLLLLGQGSEQKSLEALSENLGVQSHVTFVGDVNDVRPYLRAADIFVLPSLGEGLSNSLLEAMAMGLACVGTRIMGSVDALGNGASGILVEPNNVVQLTNALIRLVTNKDEVKRLGMLARQRVLENYDFSVVGTRYYALYNQLVIGK